MRQWGSLAPALQGASAQWQPALACRSVGHGTEGSSHLAGPSESRGLAHSELQRRGHRRTQRSPRPSPRPSWEGTKLASAF